MKRLLILLPILAVIFSACDPIATSPQSSVTEDDYFKDESQLQMFSNSFYSSLLECEYDAQSDIYLTTSLADNMYGGSHWTVPASGGSWTWTVLRKINTLLQYIHQCDDEEAVIKYTAISRFFRAYFYMEKVRRFGDVPWYETPLGSDSDELYKARDSREYVMEKMIEDLDYAAENLDNDDNCYRVDKWAALTLKSRVCLYEGTFRKYHADVGDELRPSSSKWSEYERDYNYYLQLAAEAAEKVMTEGPFKLYSTGDPSSDYLMLFAELDADPGEYILAIDYDYGLALKHNATGKNTSNTEKKPGLTRRFVNYYLMKDGTRFTDIPDWQTMTFAEEQVDRDPRLSQTIRTKGYHRIGQTALLGPDFDLSCTGYNIVKFVEDPTDGSGQVDRAGYAVNDLPVLRYAEVLVNYAEAKAELGTLTQSDLDISINLLRARVGMPDLNMASANANPDWYLMSSDYGFPNVTGNNQGVILEIRRERTIELYQENNRWWDIVRWRAGYAQNQSWVGMYFNGVGEYDLSGDGNVDTVIWSGTRPTTANDVAVYELNVDINICKDEPGFPYATDGCGYVYFHKDIERDGFDENRDYYYPIPSSERVLNPNLAQNPNWNDGLNY